jgi:hypothetical protein
VILTFLRRQALVAVHHMAGGRGGKRLVGGKSPHSLCPVALAPPHLHPSSLSGMQNVLGWQGLCKGATRPACASLVAPAAYWGWTVLQHAL